MERSAEQATFRAVPFPVELTQHLGVHLAPLALGLERGHHGVELVRRRIPAARPFPRRFGIPARPRAPRLRPVPSPVRVWVEGGVDAVPIPLRRVLGERAPLLEVDRDAHAGVLIPRLGRGRVPSTVEQHEGSVDG